MDGPKIEIITGTPWNHSPPTTPSRHMSASATKVSISIDFRTEKAESFLP